ncbi:thiamine pyrophosphate-binding protein [Paenibacillus hamazuiensis]|uniref:thiamine pyrophosphate-binding protein n=1 Tax=Paenibacillus hamazuiensis TaxID=2936508 RepID=UPI00200EAB89|nr:thiamine pyrophosphate-binding protein [Paenibacillus hamazuiensis]
MRAAEAVLRILANKGVKYIFGIPAGSINALYDALMDVPELKPIVAKHETSSGYMATAYTRITGIPSVCLGSSGPGATNLVTPAANAWKEKLPVIFITGGVPSTKRGKGGAQELDAEPIFTPVTKWSTTVLDAYRVPYVLTEALRIAQSGVPGPVHVAIPIDIQMTDIGMPWLSDESYIEPAIPDNKSVLAAAELIRSTGSRGAMLLGYGAKCARETVLRFAEQTGWMVATTPRGKGAFPEDHPLSLGVYGLAGYPKAMDTLNGSDHDVLMVVGSSLGELATGNWEAGLIRGKKLIHIDFDVAELGKNYNPDVPVIGHIELVMEHLLSLTAENNNNMYRREGIYDDARAWDMPPAEGEWNTANAIRSIGAGAPPNTRFYIDIGEFMTYSLQQLKITGDQLFDIDINFGGMGSGIGGALGAQLAEPERPVVCITGDGCFFMHGFEVLTAKEYNLPILFVVINNARLGMVYHGHMLQYKRCLSDFSQTRISIADIGKSLDIAYAQVSSLEELHEGRVKAWLDRKEPMIVEVVVAGNEVPPMGARVKFLEGATY